MTLFSLAKIVTLNYISVYASLINYLCDTGIYDDEFNTHWIDVCQGNGNLLATGGEENNIKIFDKRESKIIKTFDDIHTGNIFSFNKNF